MSLHNLFKITKQKDQQIKKILKITYHSILGVDDKFMGKRPTNQPITILPVHRSHNPGYTHRKKSRGKLRNCTNHGPSLNYPLRQPAHRQNSHHRQSLLNLVNSCICSCWWCACLSVCRSRSSSESKLVVDKRKKKRHRSLFLKCNDV